MWCLERSCHCSVRKWWMTQAEMVFIYSLAKLWNRPIVRKGNLLRAGDATVSHMGPLYQVCSHKHPPRCKLYEAWIIKGYPATALFIPVSINTVCWVSGNMNHIVSVISVVFAFGIPLSLLGWHMWGLSPTGSLILRGISHVCLWVFFLPGY